MIYIKQYSLKRAGSNYLAHLFKANFPDTKVLVNILNWKHKPTDLYPSFNRRDWYREYNPPKDEISREELDEIKRQYLNKELRYLMSIKNPYDWAVSMKKYGQNLQPANLRRLIGIWNTTVLSYYSFPDHLKTIVRYEDLVQDFDFTMDRIAGDLELKKLEQYAHIEQRVGAGNDRSKYLLSGRKFTDDVLNYHKQLTKEQVDIINNTVDAVVMEVAEYKRI